MGRPALIARQLDMLRRMRASLAGIADLDPDGVATRIVEMDWEIDRLISLLKAEVSAAATPSRAPEIVSIGLRAA